MKRAVLAAVLTALIASRAEAHKPSDSYLALRQAADTLTGQWDIALRDLDHAVGLDDDGDGAITWGELRAHHEAIAAYAMPRLELRGDGALCATHVREHLVERHSDGAYAVVRFDVDCPRVPTRLDVGYSLFFDLDPQHRSVVTVGSAGREERVVLRAEQSSRTILLGDAGEAGAFHFGIAGLRAFAANAMAVAFAVLVLAPALMSLHGRAASLAASLAIGIALGFSVVALGAAVPNAALIDGAARASVPLVLLNVWFPLPRRGRWMLVFAFGAAHGAALALSLRESPLSATATVGNLLAFHAGVEAGLAALALLLLAGSAVWRVVLVSPGVLSSSLAGPQGEAG